MSEWQLDWPDDFDGAMAHAIKLGLTTANGNPTSRCQCPTCGEVFSTEKNFDRHLTPGRLADGFDGDWCQDPATRGMVLKVNGVWCQPAEEEFDPKAVRRAVG
jgi:hypothetical protein